MRLLSNTRLFADGTHNAFTDLLHWHGHYYLAFRTAQHHGIAPGGDVVVYRSADLASWTLCTRIDTGGDDRDPKLIDAGDRLGVVFGTWFPRWGDPNKTVRGAEHDLISHVAVSRDGLVWSTPRQIYGVNYWCWRILSLNGEFYCPTYHFAERADRDMRSVRLIHSTDLFEWRTISMIRMGGGPGEPVLYQPEPGLLHCVARAEGGTHHSWLGVSKAPYTDWEWHDLGVMIHAPVVLNVGDDWICAGRSQEKDLPARVDDPDGRGHHTSVWRIAGTKAEHLITVPSAGDTSYCGLAHGPDGEVLMSYYSQHERFPLPPERPTPSDIFLARLAP